MGSCCSKKPADEEERTPFKFSEPIVSDEGKGDVQNVQESRINYESDVPVETTVNERNSFDNTLKQDELLLKANIGDQLGGDRRILTVKDFLLGKYCDKSCNIWYRTIYVLETDSLRKQFLSLNDIDMRKMDKEKFESWCDENGYPDTKKYYHSFDLLDRLPLNRILLGLCHKYEVKMHISDIFTFKGRGPYRAITCYGRLNVLIDRALNDFEMRLGKDLSIPHLAKHWDNYSFPDPVYNIADPALELPFKWLRRRKPSTPFVPRYPYIIERNIPQALRGRIGNILLEPRNQTSSNNESAKPREINTLISMKNADLITEAEDTPSYDVNLRIAQQNLQGFFESET